MAAAQPQTSGGFDRRAAAQPKGANSTTPGSDSEVSDLGNVDAKVARAKPRKSGGGVAIALVTLLMLLAGFGYAIYRRIKKSGGTEVAQAEAPPAEPPATEGDGLKSPVQPASATTPPATETPAVAEAPAVIPEIPIAQGEPAAPAADPLLDVPARPAPAVPEIPAEIPDIAQAEPAPAATPALPVELPDDPAAAPIDIAQAPDEMKLPGDAPAKVSDLELVPTAPPVDELAELPPPARRTPAAAPVEEPLAEAAGPATIDDSPATAGPVTVDERLGEYEPEAGSRPVTTTRAVAPPATAAPRLAPTTGDSRFGEYEPDVSSATPAAGNPGAIEMVAGESSDPSAPVLATDEPVAIRPRQPARAPALDIDTLTTEEPSVSEIVPVPPRTVPAPAASAVAPQAATQQQPAGVYIVAPNDNFWQISRRVYGTARPFKALTRHFEQFGLQPQQLRPGMQLAIPPRAQLESQYPELIDKNPSAFQGPGATLGVPTSAVDPQSAGEFTARSAVTPAQPAPYDPASAGAAIPVSAGEAAAVYTVQPNDNFWQISKNVYGTARVFKALSAHFEQQGVTSQRLRAGMQLPMPSRAELEARFSALIDKAPAAIQTAGASTAAPVLARGREMFSSPSFRGAPVVVGPELGAPDVMAPAGPSLATPVAEDAGNFFVSDQGHPMYKVGSDDTLTSIAQHHLGRASRWNEIFELNKAVLQTPDRLRPGIVIQLPGDASNISRSPGGVARQ